jgi:hypothetical protein
VPRHGQHWPQGGISPLGEKLIKELAMCNTEEINMNTNELIRMGFEESESANDLLQDMCECCNDAVQAHRARGYKVCLDCFHELGV